MVPFNELDQEQKRKRIMLFSKIGIFIVAGFVLAPVILSTIGGMIGLVVAGAIGFTIVMFTPVFATKIANARLKAIKAEAERNPIETLELDYEKRQTALSSFKNAITAFSAAVNTFEDKLDGFKQDFPKDSAKFEANLQKMRELLKIRQKKYELAKSSLALYDKEIQRSKAIWNMGQQAAEMNKAAGMSDDDFMQKIKVETAIDSVSTTMNKAFAELETSLIDEEGDDKLLTAASTKQLSSHAEDAAFEVVVPEKVKVKK